MQTKVFFNNSCNICRAEINHYKKHADETIDWVDISNNQDAEAIHHSLCFLFKFNVVTPWKTQDKLPYQAQTYPTQRFLLLRQPECP